MIDYTRGKMRLNFIQPPRAKEKRKHWSLPNRNMWLAGREVCEPVTTSQHKTQMQSALGPQWLHTPTIITLERWWQDPEFKVIRDTDSLSPARVFETLLHRQTHKVLLFRTGRFGYFSLLEKRWT